MICLIQKSFAFWLVLCLACARFVVVGNSNRLGRYQVNEMFEILDLRTEQANQDERFSIEETIRSVFGNEVEIIEFEPYDNEGNTTSKRAI